MKKSVRNDKEKEDDIMDIVLSDEQDTYAVQTKLGKYDIVKQGISKSQLKNIISFLQCTITQFAVYIHITPRTIQNKKDNEKISPEASERALIILDLYKKGIEVFGSITAFKKWIQTENLFLEGKKPESLLVSIYGIDYLQDELGKIEHGMLA